MSEYIGVGRFMRANGMDPRAGLSGPMTSSQTQSLRGFIAKLTPRFDPTIKGCFGADDHDHMRLGTGEEPDVTDKFDLWDYSAVRDRAQSIFDSVATDNPNIPADIPPWMPPHKATSRMPPEADGKPWDGDRLRLFSRWMAGGTPR